MKHFLYELKQPLVKSDLKRFLIEGFLASIIIGAVLGALDFYLDNLFHSVLSMITFIIFFYFLENRLYASFNQYHILYSILAVFFLLFGDYISQVVYVIFAVQTITGDISFIFQYQYFFNYVFNPMHYYTFLWVWLPRFEPIFWNIVTILLYIYISYIMFQRMKR